MIMNKYLPIVLFVSILLSGAVYSQDTSGVRPLKHEKRFYVSEDGKLFVAQTQPTYLHLSTSPDDPSKSLPLKDSKSDEPAKAIRLSEGKNIIRNPMATGPEAPGYEVYADATVPSTKAGFSGAARYESKDNVYYGPGLSFTLTSADALSGVQETYLSVNQSAFKPSREVPLDFTYDSKYLLFYYSVDNVGNVEKLKQSEYYVDVSPPKTAYKLSGIYKADILSPNVTISLSSQDNLSGVKSLLYQIDDTKKLKYKSAISVSKLSDGEHTLRLYDETM